MQMAELKNQLDKLNNVLPRGAQVYFFDYPVHNNVGDMLIWKGTEQFFKENKIQVLKRYSCHLVDYLLKKQDKLIKIPKEAIIVCQGGGNFGDLYPVHQNLRKLIVGEFPNNRIVILPQSIFYEDKKAAKKDFAIFGNHKDLHLYVRDNQSFELARQYLKNVYLCQDMAHALYPLEQKNSDNLKTLYFLRRDKERVEATIAKGDGVEIDEFDWHLLFSKVDMKLMRIFNRVHHSYKMIKMISPNILAKLWFIYNGYMINKAIKLFSDHQIIVTSRLHGHILACLMNKENKLLDNSYGKNSSYFQCWTNSIEHVELIEDPSKITQQESV